MYGFPTNVDFSFLVGNSVREARRFAPVEPTHPSNEYVILLLDADREIHIEGGRRVEGFVEPDRAAKLDDLQGRQIRHARVVSPTEMVIAFDGGITLRLFDDSSHYERVQFYPEGIIV